MLKTANAHSYLPAGRRLLSALFLLLMLACATEDVGLSTGQVDFLLVEPKAITLWRGQTIRFTVTAYDRLENQISVPEVDWRVDPRVGTIDKHGVFVAGYQIGIHEGAVRVWTREGNANFADSASVEILPGLLQTEINMAEDEDTILVEPGTYVENLDFGGKSISLRSKKGPDLTVIDGDHAGTTVKIGPGGSIIGFTISGGVANTGNGMNVSGQGTLIKGNIFELNDEGTGVLGANIGKAPGIYGMGASPIIDGNIFRDNSCNFVPAGNTTSNGVLYFVNSSSPLIVNNVFTGNTCSAIFLSAGNGSRYAGQMSIINNTIVGNTIGIRVQGNKKFQAKVFRNNIIVGNRIGVRIPAQSCSSEGIPRSRSAPNNIPLCGRTSSMDSNLFYNNETDYVGTDYSTGISDDIRADPLFVSPGVGDYRLTAGSPAIDTGSSEGAPTADADEKQRPIDGDGNGSRWVDIGAYECQALGK